MNVVELRPMRMHERMPAGARMHVCLCAHLCLNANINQMKNFSLKHTSPESTSGFANLHSTDAFVYCIDNNLEFRTC